MSYSLKSYNTFGVEAHCQYRAEISSVEQLSEILSSKQYPDPYLFLGGGSNVLFTRDWPGTVFINRFMGSRTEWLNADEAKVYAGSGVVWHDLVMESLHRGLGGLENLSLIPGTCGAAPMQNIGAYGVELKDCFDHLRALNLETLKIETFSKSECHFGYRESVFKQSLKGKYFIVEICLKLSKKSTIKDSYGAIKALLSEKGIHSPSHKDISDVVCEIRRSKLPDPAILGNAGSFFKNPVIELTKFETLKAEYADLPSYPSDDGKVKIAAGWLIEQSGWKGKIVGQTGSHKDQALVLVNYGHASGKEIFDCACQIRDDVEQKFGIELSMEVNII